MNSNTKVLPYTADKLEVLRQKIVKLSEDLSTNNSRRDEEIASSLFTLNSILFKIIVACNTNDLDTEQRIAKSLYSLYQDYIKELI